MLPGPAVSLACPACRNSSSVVARRVRSPWLPANPPYSIHACPACGHQWAEGPRDATTLAHIYSAAFHQSSQQAAATENAPVVINARRRAATLARLAPAGGRLLDIGAGNGHFVAAARPHFSAEGLEPAIAGVEAARARGLPMHQGLFPQDAPEGPFAVITLWDVLAGLDAPDVIMRAVRRRLLRDGVAIATVPLGTSRFARLTGPFWPLWIPPVNLHYYSPASLAAVAARAGLRVASITYPAKRVTLDFLARKALRSVGLARFETLCAILPHRWWLPVRLGDIATVEFRVREDSS